MNEFTKQANSEQDTGLPLCPAPNTLLSLMRSGISFYNVLLWAEGGGYANEYQMKVLNKSVLEKQDITDWKDVLIAPIEELSPSRFNMTFIIHDIDPQRVVDFAKTMVEYEAKNADHENINESESPSLCQY